jgi:hypothetical protein
MRKFERSGRLASSGLALTFGTFIMSGIDSNSSAATKVVAKTELKSTEHGKSKEEVCNQIYKSQWTSNDKFILGLNGLKFYAKDLGVAVPTLESGEYGSINCNPGYSANEVDNITIIVDVKNVSDKCLVWAYEPNNIYHQKPNAIYEHLNALCVVDLKPTIITS